MRTTFVTTADAALALLDEPVVAAAWAQRSALAGMTVGGLAAHLARAVLTVGTYLDGSPPAEGASGVDAAGYLTRALPDTSPDSDVNQQVLDRAEAGAADGPDDVRRAARGTLADLRERLPTEPSDRVLTVLGGIAIPLDEYLATRVVELVVHTDDLAASLPQLPPADLPATGEAVAVQVLAEVARRRTSTTDLVRALARRERAPDEAPRAF